MYGKKGINQWKKNSRPHLSKSPSSFWQPSTFRLVVWHWTSDSLSTSDKLQRRRQWSQGRAQRYTGTVTHLVTPTSLVCSSLAFTVFGCCCAWWWSEYFSLHLTFVVIVFAAAVAHSCRVLTRVLCSSFLTCTRNDFPLSSTLRRIDVSPRAFKKHAQLFEAVKNSEDGTYKVTEHFAESSLSDRTKSEWVSQCLLDCPLLMRVGVPQREREMRSTSKQCKRKIRHFELVTYRPHTCF